MSFRQRVTENLQLNYLTIMYVYICIYIIYVYILCMYVCIGHKGLRHGIKNKTIFSACSSVPILHLPFFSLRDAK